MKFSIVTPSFNQGRFIRDCIASVKSQTGVEWEHIIQDAGSTDETLAVLQEYPHLKVTCEKDRGMSDGINRGFLKATGDWVMWLNTDDYLLPGALAQVAAQAAQHPQVGIIYGDCNFVTEDKTIIRRKADHRFDLNVLLFYGCYIQSTSTFIRRDIIQAGQLLDVELKVCMDFDYYLRLALAGHRFVYLPAVLAGFRWHDSNTSTVFAERRYEERLQVQRQHLQTMGRSWLGNECLLKCLHQIYRLKRGLLRSLDSKSRR